MDGILYGVGVGPGEPDLMTLKAVKLIKENEVIALPGKEPRETVAYQIAAAAVPELAGKQLLPVYMPMTHDKEEQKRCHREGAALVEGYLKQGKNVVFLTLGDSAVYSTFTYIQKLVEEDGFQTQAQHQALRGGIVENEEVEGLAAEGFEDKACAHPHHYKIGDGGHVGKNVKQNEFPQGRVLVDPLFDTAHNNTPPFNE